MLIVHCPCVLLVALHADLTDPLYESASTNDDFVRYETSVEVYDAAINVRAYAGVQNNDTFACLTLRVVDMHGVLHLFTRFHCTMFTIFALWTDRYPQSTKTSWSTPAMRMTMTSAPPNRQPCWPGPTRIDELKRKAARLCACAAVGSLPSRFLKFGGVRLCTGIYGKSMSPT